MKKLLTLLLSVSMIATLLVGCGAAKTEEAPATETVETTETEATEEGLKIAIVSSPSGVDDGSFNQNNYEGILAFIEANPGATVTPVKEETGDVAAAVQAVADIVADYDVIVCCGFQFQGIGTVAQENPDVNFILVDAYPTDAEGTEIEVENIYAMQFKEQESGFCAGIAAALETKTGKVAVVNGIAFPSNVNYQYGFESGVNYANKNYGTTAEVVAEALIGEGVDMIFVAAGASGNGVLTACKEAEGVFYIGCDVDQYDDGANGDANVILTSALKVMDMNVELQLTNVLNGTFAGANALLGADTYSTGFVSEEGRHQMQADTVTKVTESFEKVVAGEIVPAANFNGMTPDAFTGL